MRVLALTITRAATPDRARLLNNTLTLGRESAGCEFDWHVHVNGATLAKNIVEAALATRVVTSHTVSDINVGQHPPMNDAIKRVIDGGYDYLVRVDDDVEWSSKRWMAKLVAASVAVGDKMVLSPAVRGLRWQPPQSPQRDVEGVPLKFIEGPIGGICRLMPVSLLKAKPYVSDVRLPMGGGDAGGVGNWGMVGEPMIPLAYCQHLKIRHAKSTDGQVADDPAHFENHALYQYAPYIPAWEGE